MSVINVLADIARKHALIRRELIPATFWVRIAVAVVFAAMMWLYFRALQISPLSLCVPFLSFTTRLARNWSG